MSAWVIVVDGSEYIVRTAQNLADVKIEQNGQELDGTDLSLDLANRLITAAVALDIMNGVNAEAITQDIVGFRGEIWDLLAVQGLRSLASLGLNYTLSRFDITGLARKDPTILEISQTLSGVLDAVISSATDASNFGWNWGAAQLIASWADDSIDRLQQFRSDFPFFEQSTATPINIDDIESAWTHLQFAFAQYQAALNFAQVVDFPEQSISTSVSNFAIAFGDDVLVQFGEFLGSEWAREHLATTLPAQVSVSAAQAGSFMSSFLLQFAGAVESIDDIRNAGDFFNGVDQILEDAYSTFLPFDELLVDFTNQIALRYGFDTSTTNPAPPTPPAEFDYGNTPDTAFVINLPFEYGDNSVGGGTDYADWFRFVAPDDGELNAQISGLSADLTLELYSATTQQLAWSANSGFQDESITYDIDSGVTYYLRVNSVDGSRGDYQLNFNFTETPFDYGNSRDDAFVVSLPFSYDDNSVGGDDPDDYFRFVAPSDGTFTGILSGLSDDLNLRLYSASGQQLESSTSEGTESERIDYAVSNGDVYYVRVDPDGAASSSYQIELLFSGDDAGSGGSGGSDGIDLTADITSTNGAVFRAGDTLEIDWLISNLGDVAAGRTYSGVYLSTNRNITSNDRLLHRESTVGELDPGEVDDEYEEIVLPNDLRPGTYYLAVVADVDGDLNDESNTENNVSSLIEIVIEGDGPDLILTENTLESGSSIYRPGDSLVLDWRAVNVGDDFMPASYVGIYLSTDSTIDENDELIGVKRTNNLSINEADRMRFYYDLPDDLDPGQYWVGAIGDYDNQVSESNETNNSGPVFQIEVGEVLVEGRDLVTQISEITPVLRTNTEVSVAFESENRGNVSAPTTIIGLYLSADEFLSEGDLLLATDIVSFLSSGEIDFDTDTFDMPDEWDDGTTIYSGTYYLIPFIDYDDRADEIDESNNDDAILEIQVIADDADYIIEGFAVNADEYDAGSYILLSYTAYNIGLDYSRSGSLADILTGIYISEDSDVTTNDRLIDTEFDSVLDMGDSQFSSIASWIPLDLAPGTYYVAAIADHAQADIEQDETNNVSNVVEITVKEPSTASMLPDITTTILSAAYISTSDRTGNHTYELTYNIKNIGESLAPDAIIRFYASANPTYDDSAAFIGGSGFDPLLAGAEISETDRIAIRDDLAQLDEVFVFTVADYLNEATESNEVNNLSQSFSIPLRSFTDQSDFIRLSATGLLREALAGDDMVIGSEVDDLVELGVGDDEFYGGLGADTAIGGDGEDILFGESGNDNLHGNEGSDTLWGGSGDDTIIGGEGNDFVIGGIGADLLDGGSGIDWISLSDSSISVQVNLSTGRGFGGDADGDEYISIENVTGSELADTITGSAAANELSGLAGNDRIWGGNGDDTLSGGAGNDLLRGELGNDTINGGDGADTLIGFLGNDMLSGGEGNDFLNAGAGDDEVFGGFGNDILLGGDGVDVLNGEDGWDIIRAHDGNDTVNAGEGSDTAFGGAGDDTLSGGVGDDALIGNLGMDTISGGEGGDFLYGNEDADTINGDGGADFAFGGTGNDTIDGGEGHDRLFGEDGDDMLIGGLGNDLIRGGEGNDTVTGGEGYDYLIGQAGDDIMSGGDLLDFLVGGAGNDTLNGDAGNDRLFGDEGNDILNGGIGNDILRGGTGSDTLTGGDGFDAIVFQDAFGTDTITDFEGGIDVIIFSGVSGISSLADLALSQVGNDVLITYGDGSNTVTVQNMLLADLTGTDFGIG